MTDSSLPSDPSPPRVVRPAVIAPPPVTLARRAVPTVRPRRVPPPSVLPLMLVIGTFAGMMGVSFAHSVWGMFTAEAAADQPDEVIRARMVNELLVFEGVDTLIVLAGLLVAGRPRPTPAAGRPTLAWAFAVPGFVLLIGFNIGYTLALRAIAQAVAPPDPETVMIDVGLRQGAWAILLICVQPAVIEELFFRHLLYGHLRSHLGVHAAVWVSAVIFGMAHLGNVGGWPVLIVVGAGLGYARAYSGGLALPIVLHFLHNLTVLGADELLR
ncbi:MAG: CPBP family intramembrane glutamic endopeptidase [Gemmataceae bacterium]